MALAERKLSSENGTFEIIGKFNALGDYDDAVADAELTFFDTHIVASVLSISASSARTVKAALAEHPILPPFTRSSRYSVPLKCLD